MARAMGFPDGSGDEVPRGVRADDPAAAAEEPPLSPTAYALLGLLMFAGRTDTAVTAYELKQRADRTLRYYWVAPAMSQVYSEVNRLVAAGLAEARAASPDDEAPAAGARRTTRYVITDEGERRLRHWLTSTRAEFPVLKHPVALRLLMGHLSSPETIGAMLDDYAADLVDRRGDLQAVRELLGDRPEVRYPAMVADWGLAYYDSESRIVAELRDRMAAEAVAEAAAAGRPASRGRAPGDPGSGGLAPGDLAAGDPRSGGLAPGGLAPGDPALGERAPGEPAPERG